MQINNSGVNNSQSIGQTTDAASSGAKVQRGPSEHGDQVHISDIASQLSADPERVAQLQASVSSGTYNVSAGQVAGGMIQEMMQTF